MIENSNSDRLIDNYVKQVKIFYPTLGQKLEIIRAQGFDNRTEAIEMIKLIDNPNELK